MEIVRARGRRPEIRIYATAAEALAAGIVRSVIDRIWGHPPKPAPPDCQTLGEWDPRKGDVWITCINNGCDSSEGCHLLSWPREGPDDTRDEGTGGRWAEPGRVYQCSCVYSD
ncbi:hypothetical protein HHL11_07685 [Ramlibacter sp. G-1-2-2]|uniref:Uncharacterized protein n=1 Tax=Ramlibacter agri TaxID=2728837 RepID=A0A848GYG7_9BURK|nr:hypothetical protein [Ramlibacter agri]NML43625.1 hypothetical protein [Ramlibacter agri]